MRTIVDLHVHSKYSRATSKHLDIHEIAKWSNIKGLNIVSCGDFTHPRWFSHINETIREDGSGFLRHEQYPELGFILATEVACIYRHQEKTRRLHHVILSPSLASAKKINEQLENSGAKLASDGRPIIGMSSKQLLEIILEADARNVLIPAHVWTPWFAIFGSKSGYDSVQECFEDLAPHIFALETGLSSDPEMNWSLSQLDQYALVSNSDAHSGPKLGREANVFDLQQGTYDEMVDALKKKDKKKFLFTIEFFPEEGMYHYDGHRACGFSCDPAETKRLKALCPRCRKPLTIGVMHRVDNLRDRALGSRHDQAIDFKKIIPLPEIIADFFSTSSTQTKKVQEMFFSCIQHGKNEFNILLDLPLEILRTYMPEELAQGIIRVREGKVQIRPGYDGIYGKVDVFSPEHRGKKQQRALF